MSILVGDVIDDLAILPQVCPGDPRLYRYINEGMRRIFLEGKYVGVYGRYNFRLYDGMITLPYECDTLLAADVLSRPVLIHNEWFEFLQSGPGMQNSRLNYTYSDFFDRGNGYCVIQDPPGPFTVKIYCAVPEDPNATLTLIGLDAYGNSIRSQIPIQNGDGTITSQWINGVQNNIFSATSPYLETAQLFSVITAIILPKRNGDLRLIANTRNPQTFQPTGITYMLGVYPYFMTNPNFRRYHFPTNPPPGPTSEFCRGVCANALVRRRVIPVSSPSDFLSIDNIPALKYYVMSAFKDEEEQYDIAETLRLKGKYFLEQELKETSSTTDRLNVQLRGFGIFPTTPGAIY